MHYAITSTAEGLEIEGKEVEVLEDLELEVVILRKDGMSSKCCGRAENLAGNGWKAQARKVTQ